MQELQPRNTCRPMVKGATVDIAGLGPFAIKAVSTQLLSPISQSLGFVWLLRSNRKIHSLFRQACPIVHQS